MAEIIPIVGPNKSVDFIDQSGRRIGIGPLSPEDAAFLARGILSCAAVLASQTPVNIGTMIGDAHLPITNWTVGTTKATGAPALVLSIPSGIQLTFQMTLQGAKELGWALTVRGETSGPLEDQRGTVH